MKCRECGHQVSDQASTCPNCGVDRPSEAAHQAHLAELGRRKRAEEKSQSDTAKGALGCLVLVAILVMWCGIAFDSDSGSTSTSTRTTATRASPSASQLQARLNELGAGDAILRVSADDAIAYVTVADGWYILPCFQRQRVAKGLRAHWRSLGGSNLVVQDIAGTTIATFRILSDDYKITGCD